MLCCIVGTAAIGALSMRRGALRRQGALPLAFVAVVTLSLTLLAGWHVGHYVARANANERSVISEIIAQPICSGVSDRHAPRNDD